MVIRGDHRARTFWRGHGLQRFSNDGTEGERQSVLLRSETGCVGRDRVCSHVAGNAIQLPAAQVTTCRFRSAVFVDGDFAFGLCVQ